MATEPDGHGDNQRDTGRARILKGIAWLTAAIVAQTLDKFVYQPIGTPKMATLTWLDWLVAAIGQINGFTTLAIIFAVTSFGYLVIYPVFLAPLVAQVGLAGDRIHGSVKSALDNTHTAVREGFSQISDAVSQVSPDTRVTMINRWILNHEGTVDELRGVAISALQEFYGGHSSDEKSYLRYLLNNFLDRSAAETGQWREHLTTEITLQRISSSHELAGKGFLSWHETRHYILICPAGEGKHPLDMYAWLEVNNVECIDLLKNQNITITINNTNILFSLGDVIDSLTDDDLNDIQSGKGFKKNGLEIRHDGSNLQINFKTIYEITNKETTVVVSEQGFIKENDCSFVQTMPYPARGMTIKFQLVGDLSNWVVSDADVSPQHYHDEGENLVWFDPSYPVGSSNQIHLHVSDWVLPGSVAVIRWGPKS